MAGMIEATVIATFGCQTKRRDDRIDESNVAFQKIQKSVSRGVALYIDVVAEIRSCQVMEQRGRSKVVPQGGCMGFDVNVQGAIWTEILPIASGSRRHSIQRFAV